jgi:hypothetical protein
MAMVFFAIVAFNPDIGFSAGKGGGKPPKYLGLSITGQTIPYATGDDGDLQKGVPWPDPRFTDNGDGTVTDKLTGLIWMKNANAFGIITYVEALTAANTLSSGMADLTDGSQAGDWRLPNLRELHSLVNYGSQSPALPPDHPFTNVQSVFYWSSTAMAQAPLTTRWTLRFVFGDVQYTWIETVYPVWCVRNALP